MGFANVNSQKISAILIILINLNDVANLAAERRSSKTPEDQHERPVTQRRRAPRALLVKRGTQER